MILDIDLGVIGRASRASLINRANSVLIRASGGEVTASRVRGEVTSEAGVLYAASMVISARIAQRVIGPHSSRVPVMRHRDHFFQLPSQLQPRCQPYQPFQQLQCSRSNCSMDVSITSTR